MAGNYDLRRFEGLPNVRNMVGTFLCQELKKENFMLVSKINIVRLAYSALEISNCDTYNTNTKTCEVPLTASLDKPKSETLALMCLSSNILLV